MLTRQEVVNNFILNVEKERVSLNLTQAQMAKKLEMSLSGYKKMTSGVTTKIDFYTVYLLYHLTGKWAFEMIDECPREATFLKKLKEMSPSQLNFIGNFIDFELAFSDSLKHTPEACGDYITVYIPTGNMEDGMIYDSSNYTKVNAAIYRRKFGEDLHCGIRITSSHLLPVYCPDDILLICRKAIREGDTGIFFNKKTGRVYIRRFLLDSGWNLAPVNGYGQTIHIDPNSRTDMENWIGLGYVLSKMRV